MNPKAANATPFHTSTETSIRLPCRRSACFAAIIASNVGKNQRKTLKCDSRSGHQRQDLDSYQDNLGKLHRNTLDHTRSKLEWNTPPLFERELLSLQNILNSGIINSKERKLKIIHYCFDTHTYEQGEFYMPDITFTPLLIRNGEVLMDKVRLAFIEY